MIWILLYHCDVFNKAKKMCFCNNDYDKNTFFEGCQSWTLTSDIMGRKTELQSRDKK